MSEDSRTGRSRPPLVVANPDDETKSHRPPNGFPPRTTTGARPFNGMPNPYYSPYPPYPMNYDYTSHYNVSDSPDRASPSSPPSTPGMSSLFKASDRDHPSYPLSPPSHDPSSSNTPSFRRGGAGVRAPIGGRPPTKKPPGPRQSPTTQDPPLSRGPVLSSPAKLIMVTTDYERFVTVDLTAATSAAQMRELILSKLQIFNEDESSPYLIYQTEIGEKFAIGEPLSDSRLFTLCREMGDSRGTLKFLLMHPVAPVHEPPPPLHPGDYSLALPPVLPIKPLRPKGRQASRSRNGSVSSSSELLTPEMVTGYEADDDRDTRSIPSQNHLPASPPKHGSPSRRPSVASQPRSGSPDLPPSPMPTLERKSISRKDERPGHSLPPVPMGPPPLPVAPPLSPNKPSFYDDISLPDRRHIRSGSDAGADQEHIFRTHEPLLRREHHHPSLQPLRPQDSYEYTASNRPPRRNYEEADTAQEIIMPTSERGTDEPERSSPTHRRHNQPLHRRPISPFTTRNPPRPAPPMPSTRNFPTKPRTGILPLGGTPIGHDQAFKLHVMEPRYGTSRTLTKQGTKSVNDLKSVGHAHSVRRNQVTPNLPIISSPNSRDTAYSPNNSMHAMSKSFDPRNGTRPLPNRLPTGNSPDIIGSSSGQYGTRVMPPTLISPSYEPYQRPLSAAGEAISPTRGYSSRLQSPTVHGSSLDSGDNNPSPRTVSPNRNYHSPGFIPGPRPRPTASSELSSDPSGPENSNTPPLTPQDPQRDERGYVDPSPLLSPPGILDKDENSGSELTLKEDKRQYFSDILSNASSTPTGTMVSTKSVSQSRNDELFKQDDSPSSSDDEDSYIGGGTWIVKPETGKSSSGTRPRITVQIETPTNGHVDSTLRQEPLSKENQPPASRPAASSSNSNLLRVQAKRPESTFIDPDNDNWAPRPPPENIYEELEKFFPKHDLDKPVIEATSGETSPTNAEPVAALLPAPTLDEKSRIKAKKSIRYVAQEHRKRIDRTSRAADTILQKDSMIRKRSTKLWGSKLEEVTTLQGRNNSSISLPESPSGGPTTFKWVRGELIGKGTYGRVYLALNATTGEMIAVKQVELPQTASDKNDSRQHTVVQALKMESETLRELDHPNIVQYLGFEETPANLSIFLEYVPGGSVGSCLHKHGKFADNVTRSFTAQILSGLEYLHSKGILHRDMKADNILVEMSGVCKISDFGISKRTEDLQGGAFTAMQGTVFWMAPEVVNAQKTGYNFKVDIWSLGCVVLEMWAGMRPWTGEEMVAVMFKLYQSKQPPPVPEDVVLGEDADDFRRKCFAINPEERPSAAELRKHSYLTLPPGWVFTGFT